MLNELPRIHDVIVIGAGPAGSSAAAVMARAGLDVVILDKADFPRDKTCGDAVSARGVHVLENLGLGIELRRHAHPIHGVRITSPSGIEVQTRVPAAKGLPGYGVVMPRVQLDDLILRQAVGHGAQFFGKVHVREVELGRQTVSIRGEARGRSARYRGRATVLAVGASLPLARSLGLAPNPPAYSFAARAYFENVDMPTDVLDFRFDGVPLPGYGWLFPLSDRRANIGAGYYHRSAATPSTAAATLEQLLAHPPIQDRLRRARQVGPVKGFPIRTDFARANVYAHRLLVAGESAGLVNPFTAEGIDYALESGQAAGQVLIEACAADDFGLKRMRTYERAIRQRFQSMFVIADLMRRAYMRPGLLDPLLGACSRWPVTARLLIDVLLSYRHPIAAFSPGILARLLTAMLIGPHRQSRRPWRPGGTA